jgi:putative oxidoreductase
MTDQGDGRMLFWFRVDWARWTPRMLSVLRIVVALLFLQHGLSKLVGFPVTLPPDYKLVSLLGLLGVIETVGSLLLLVGLFTRAAAFILAVELAAVCFMRPQFYPLADGRPVEAVYSLLFMYFLFAGPGTWSLDLRHAAAKR